MNRTTKILLVLASIIGGYIVLGVAYAYSLNPRWLNAVLMLIGIVLAGFGLMFVLVKIIMRIVNDVRKPDDSNIPTNSSDDKK